MDLISFAHKGWRFKYINISRKFNLHKLGRFKGSLHLIPDDADSSQVQRRHGCIYGVKFMYKFNLLLSSVYIRRQGSHIHSTFSLALCIYGDKVHAFIQPSPQFCVSTETRFKYLFNLLLSSVYIRRQGSCKHSSFFLALFTYGDKVQVFIQPSHQFCVNKETRFM